MVLVVQKILRQGPGSPAGLSALLGEHKEGPVRLSKARAACKVTGQGVVVVIVWSGSTPLLAPSLPRQPTSSRLVIAFLLFH